MTAEQVDKKKVKRKLAPMDWGGLGKSGMCRMPVRYAGAVLRFFHEYTQTRTHTVDTAGLAVGRGKCYMAGCDNCGWAVELVTPVETGRTHVAQFELGECNQAVNVRNNLLFQLLTTVNSLPRYCSR